MTTESNPLPPRVTREEVARTIAEKYSALMAARFPARMGFTGAAYEVMAEDDRRQAEQIAEAVLALFPAPKSAAREDGSSGVERAASLPAEADCSAAQSFAGHEPACPVSKAATCAVGIECEHGFDVCGICDRCTCGPFQARVLPWMLECFGPVIPFDKVERGDRLLEEVFETLQSGGYDPARVAALRDYVWGRPVGEPRQEVGGVMVTLAAYCIAHEIDMHEAGEAELARIWTKVPQIRAKQAAKPTGSALPVAAPPAPQSFGGWRDIASAPKDGTPILVWRADVRPGVPYCAITSWPNGWRGSWPTAYMHYADGHDPTHWMPLPEPPAPPSNDLSDRGGEG